MSKPKIRRPRETRENSERMRKLDQWLAQGRQLWSASVALVGDVECWHVGDATCLVVRYLRGGWDVYTGTWSLSIDDTLADAAGRIGALTLADCVEAGIGVQS